jgi:hypothetical protein
MIPLYKCRVKVAIDFAYDCCEGFPCLISGFDYQLTVLLSIEQFYGVDCVSYRLSRFMPTGHEALRRGSDYDSIWKAAENLAISLLLEALDMTPPFPRADASLLMDRDGRSSLLRDI